VWTFADRNSFFEWYWFILSCCSLRYAMACTSTPCWACWHWKASVTLDLPPRSG